ncbi:hypothetical protein RhiXN_00983 [Rhizoctonia solani]|uniref:Uncharacterized protein n=1 Tax=Rhizoctonia solani TaxID=456999 RepID=A0A8H8NWW4_9AGAM|nr:uncharacterized protein RhiXN_00983 [Rhizoctonia solani]QRW19577.1 hypothetical protein RhiXN_00983 [Rhizoctonia solani]
MWPSRPRRIRKPFDRSTMTYVYVSEEQPLVVGLDEKARRRRRCRRFAHFIVASIALILIGYGSLRLFAYKYAHSHIECVPYEGGKTIVNLPILYPRSAVLLDSSISSGDVFVTRVETHTNEVKVTFEEDSSSEEEAEIRLCTLKGGKLTGVGIYASKKGQQDLLPVIKSVKVEIPKSVPPPSVDLLPPPRRHHCLVRFFKWAGVWDSKQTEMAKLRDN